MTTPPRIQGLHHALALMRLAYAHDPNQARSLIEAWITNLEQAEADPLHLRQMRSRLQALTGEAGLTAGHLREPIRAERPATG